MNSDSESRHRKAGPSTRAPATNHRSLITVVLTALLTACAQVPSAPEAEGPDAPGPAVHAPLPTPAPIAEKPAEAAPPSVVIAHAPPLPPADVWARIRSGFRLSNLDGALVQQWEQWYSTRPDYVARMVERGSHFLYHVIEEIERRKMPAEIALLPMIESAYNPQAYSRAHAAGMWQFIPSTGKLYGLQQNFWYDGRRDVMAATGAALDYLEKLYGMFNDWNLALAAYNWGEGAVSRAMARNQAKGLPTDYESLSMPAETRNYLPKLQAVKNIIANPEQFGIRLAEVPNKPFIGTVTVPRHIDVKLAATFAEISLEDFKFLNPAHNKPVIRADGSEVLVLPVAKIDAFKRNFAAFNDGPMATWQAYTVKRSDSQEKIAAKHGISVARLKEVNGINGRRNIVAGQTILVPHKGTAEPNLPDLPAAKITRAGYQPKKRANCVQVVKAGKKQLRCSAPAKGTTVAKKQTTSKKAVTKKAPARAKRTDVAAARN